MHSVAQAVERLQSPYAPETFSVLTGEPALLVSLEAAGSAPGEAGLERALATLAELPGASIALAAGEPSGAAARLGDRCDVCVSSEEELAAVLATVERTPLASLALVQLLRQGEQLDVHQGLIAESLVYSVLQSGPEFASWRASRADPPPAREHPEPAVLAARSGDRLSLTLNRPEKRNAYSAEMRDSLVEALRVAVGDPSISEIEIGGAGPSFCSGGDLDEFGTLPDPATAHAVRSTRNAARLLAACADRVTVRVHGACVGAGVELPAFAGTVIAQADAFFALPELAMGLVPGAGGTVSIPRRVGRQRCAYLALSGVRLDAETARAWGLVDRLA